MTYQKKFKQIVHDTAVGYLVGVIISIIIVCFFSIKGEMLVVLKEVLLYTLGIGSAISIILSAKTGNNEYLIKPVCSILKSLKNNIASLFNTEEALIAFFKMIGLTILMLPFLVYMIVSYPLNFAYLGIMSSLEKRGKLNGTGQYSMLDSIISLIPLGVAIYYFMELIIKHN